MRILCVAVYRSNHCDRHVNILAGAGHDVHLIVLCRGPKREPLHPGVTVHPWRGDDEAALHPAEAPGSMDAVALMDGQPVTDRDLLAVAGKALLDRQPGPAAAWLANGIDAIQPDLLHSFSIHQAGFLTLAARSRCVRPFPRWIVSNWGCDIHFFSRELDYRRATVAVLQAANGYFAECARDVGLARRHGFRGRTLAIQPIGGGFELPAFHAMRRPGPTSGRRLILIKGYQGLVGRAAFALAAMQRIADRLRPYRLALYGLNADIVDPIAEFEQACGMKVEIIPFLPYDDLMRLHGQARCSIGLGVSDGICTSAIEAMLMGSLPLQSDTSCLGEWAGASSVLLVPPEDPAAIAEALARAVTNDGFVDQAVARNDSVLRMRFSSEVVNPKILAMYEKALL